MVSTFSLRLVPDLFHISPEMQQAKKRPEKFSLKVFQKVDNCTGCSNTKVKFMLITSCLLNNHL